jgi:ABC-type glycerol-3-phosphate transport system substrate-binding protein
MLATGIMTGCASGSAPKEGGKTTEQAAGQSVDTGKQEERKEKAKLTLVLRAGSYTDVMKNLAPAFAEEHNCEFEFLDLGFTDMYQKIALDSQNRELAMEFIQYITDAGQQADSVQYGGVPTRTSVYENPDIIAQSPNLEYVYQALKEAVYRPRIKQWTEITVTLGTELDNAVQGAKSVDDALKDAQTACEQIMKN